MRTVFGAAGTGGGLLALIGWLATLSTPTSAGTVLDLASVLVPAAAAIFAGLAAQSTHGRIRGGWVAMTVGLACAAVGEGIWAYRDLAGVVLTFPSPADVAYLTFLIGVLVALLLFPAGGDRYQSRARLVLDGIVMAVSMFVVAWVTVIRDIVVAENPSRLVLPFSLAYPVLNLVALTVAAVSLARSGSGQRLMLTLLTGGLFAMTLAEGVFAYLAVSGPFSGHHVVELVWLTGMSLILVATVEGRRATFDDQRAEPSGWASVWLPYAPFMLAAVVLASQPREVVGETPVLVAGLILLPAILLRQFLAVAETRRLVAAVAEQALHDPLTGLSNRALFSERLEGAIAAARRAGSSVGVVLLDLDDFKLVNDNFGHACGDELLVGAADRLRETAGDENTVARLGGDEFAVVVSGSVRAIRETADRLAAAFQPPFLVEGNELRLRPTVGLAVAESSELSATALLKQADTAMYSGKRSKAVGVQVFSAAMLTGVGRRESGSLRTLTELRTAVDTGGLELVYRPQADLRTGAVVGVEALLRWPHPDRGLLLPQHFLPLIRRHGLIQPVTELVVRRALDDAECWQRNGIHVTVAVNLFAPSLEDEHLPARVEALLAQRGLRPDTLTFEITEDLPIDRDGSAGKVLAGLRELGIRIAVDDFGSGYSSLSDLCRLPIDEIKFDEGFVGAVLVDPKVAAVVRAVIRLAGDLGLTTVGEGVRTVETARRLLEFGCEVGQGDLFGGPLRAAELPAFLGRTTPAGPMPAADRPGTVAP